MVAFAFRNLLHPPPSPSSTFRWQWLRGELPQTLIIGHELGRGCGEEVGLSAGRSWLRRERGGQRDFLFEGRGCCRARALVYTYRLYASSRGGVRKPVVLSVNVEGERMEAGEIRNFQMASVIPAVHFLHSLSSLCSRYTRASCKSHATETVRI